LQNIFFAIATAEIFRYNEGNIEKEER